MFDIGKTSPTIALHTPRSSHAVTTLCTSENLYCIIKMQLVFIITVCSVVYACMRIQTYTTNTRRQTRYVLMLLRRRRRWANNKPPVVRVSCLLSNIFSFSFART